jgi:hypothetical protein
MSELLGCAVLAENFRFFSTDMQEADFWVWTLD